MKRNNSFDFWVWHRQSIKSIIRDEGEFPFVLDDIVIRREYNALLLRR